MHNQGGGAIVNYCSGWTSAGKFDVFRSRRHCRCAWFFFRLVNSVTARTLAC